MAKINDLGTKAQHDSPFFVFSLDFGPNTASMYAFRDKNGEFRVFVEKCILRICATGEGAEPPSFLRRSLRPLGCLGILATGVRRSVAKRSGLVAGESAGATDAASARAQLWIAFVSEVGCSWIEPSLL